jgi:hypothetical protein
MPEVTQAGVRDGLISIWPFDEGTGDTTADAVGSNTGALVEGQGGGVAPSWNIGKFGSGLYFDGISAYVDAGGDDTLKPKNVTVAAWVNQFSIGYYAQVAGFAWDTGAEESGYSVMSDYYIGSTPGYCGWISGGEVVDGSYTSKNSNHVLNTWNHVAMTYDGARAIVYVNSIAGTPHMTEVGDINYVYGNTFKVGLYQAGGWWLPYVGYIDEVAVWDRALTAEEMSGLWNGGAGLSLAPVVEPTPENHAQFVPLDQVLSWDLIGATIADSYDVWFGSDVNEASPGYDFAKVKEGTTDTTYAPTGMVFDKTYYWKVDVYEVNDVGTIFREGYMWDFTTVGEFPVVTVQPQDQMVKAGETAEFSVEGVNITTYTWYKSVDDAVDTPGDDTQVATSQILTITDVQSTDVGYYFCLVSNGVEEATSETASLALKKIIGYWQLDGDYLDSSGLDNHGDPNGDPTFVAGLVGSHAVDLDGDDYIRIDAVADDLPTNDLTLSGWVKTSDLNADWYACNTADFGNVFMWSIDTGYAALYEGAYEGHSTTMVSDDQWHLLTYVRIGSTGHTYVDGSLEATHTADFSLSPDNLWSLGQEWDGGGPSDFLTGLLDDVRMYNYGLDQIEVANLYLGVYPDAYVCLGKPDMDFDGNCKVDINDFAEIAATWAECNLVPTCLP